MGEGVDVALEGERYHDYMHETLGDCLPWLQVFWFLCLYVYLRKLGGQLVLDLNGFSPLEPNRNSFLLLLFSFQKEVQLY